MPEDIWDMRCLERLNASFKPAAQERVCVGIGSSVVGEHSIRAVVVEVFMLFNSLALLAAFVSRPYCDILSHQAYARHSQHFVRLLLCFEYPKR